MYTGSLHQPSKCEVKLGEHISTIKWFDQKSSEFLEKAKMEKRFGKNAFFQTSQDYF